MDVVVQIEAQAHEMMRRAIDFVGAHETDTLLCTGLLAVFTLILCFLIFGRLRSARKRFIRLEKQFRHLQEFVNRMETRQDRFDLIAMRLGGSSLSRPSATESSLFELQKKTSDESAA